MDIQGKVAVVTGAAQGIGEAVTRAFSSHGLLVAAIDQQADTLQTLITDVCASGHTAVAYPADISDSASVNTTVKCIEENIGPIDILVNVAGILHVDAVQSISDTDWAAIFAVNSTGTFYMSRAVARYMIPRTKGVIITVGSNAAKCPRINMAAYAASKAAVTMFTKCLGLELAQYNIRCNIVSPGSTDTAMQRLLWTDETSTQKIIGGTPKQFRLGIPLGKIAIPSDIANAVLFLCSEQAHHITMQDICIDGGATLGV